MSGGRDIRLLATASAAVLCAACASVPVIEAPFGPTAADGSRGRPESAAVLTRLAPAAVDPAASRRASALPLPLPPPRVAIYEDSSPRTGAGADVAVLRLGRAVRLPLPAAPAAPAAPRAAAIPAFAGGVAPLVEPRLRAASGRSSLAAGSTTLTDRSATQLATAAEPQVAPTRTPTLAPAASAPRAAPLPAARAASPSPAPRATAPLAAVSPQAPGSASSPSGSPASERTYARVGDRLELTLPGEGWIYLGDLHGQASGLSYGDRTIGDGATSFTFRAQRLGEFLLEFQLQDHRTGGQQRQHLNVAIVAPSELQRIIAAGGKPSQPAAADVEIERAMEHADRLYDDGLFDLALAAYQRVAAADPASTAALHRNDRLAALHARRGEWGRADQYWRRNLDAAADLPPADPPQPAAVAAGGPAAHPPELLYLVDARMGLARSAIARDDASAVAEMLSALLELPATAESSEVKRDAVALLQDAERWEPALLLLQSHLQGGSTPLDDGRRDAEMRYRLAEVLESPWAGRDLRQARRHYLAVAEEFPASRFARPALERVRYLDRHYFVVQ